MTEISTVRTVESVTLEIKTLHRQAQNLMLGYAIEIGRRLVEVKELLPHGEWGEYLKTQVDYSQSTANNFMRIFEEYGSSQQCIFGAEANSQTLGNLPYTKALTLLALPAEEREEFVIEHNVEELSTRELKELIKERDEMKARADELEKSKKDISASLHDATLERDAAKEELRRVERELETLASRPVDVAVETVIDEKAIEAARAEARAETEEKLKAKLQKAKEAKDKAEEKLKQAQELQQAAESKLAQEKNDSTKAVEELKKQLKVAGNQDVAVFKLHFGSIQDTFGKLLGTLKKLKDDGDMENYEKLKAAVAAMLEQWKGAVST